METVLECIRNRRSVRQYTDRQIREDDLARILEAGIYAPSGMCTQDRHFTAIRNQEKLQELNRIVRKAASFSDSPSLKKNADNESFSIFYHAPTLIVVSAGVENITPASDCAVSLENMFLAAWSLTISSCWINAFNQLQENPDILNFFRSVGMPDDHTIYGAGAFGYNAGEVPQAAPRRENVITIIK